MVTAALSPNGTPRPYHIRRPELWVNKPVKFAANWRDFDGAHGFTVCPVTGRLLRIADILNSPAMVAKITAQVHEFVAAEADAQIAALVTQVRADVAIMEALEEQVTTAKARLRILLRQRGENFTDELGYARLVNDFVRTSYNTGALDLLIIADEERYGWLRDHHKQITVRGGVQVK